MTTPTTASAPSVLALRARIRVGEAAGVMRAQKGSDSTPESCPFTRRLIHAWQCGEPTAPTSERTPVEPHLPRDRAVGDLMVQCGVSRRRVARGPARFRLGPDSASWAAMRRSGSKAGPPSLRSYAARSKSVGGSVTFTPSETEAYREGSVGWAATKLTIRLPDGTHVAPAGPRSSCAGTTSGSSCRLTRRSPSTTTMPVGLTSSTRCRLLGAGVAVSGTVQHAAEVDDELHVDVLVLRTREHFGLAADVDDVFPVVALLDRSPASSNDSTAGHSML